MYVYSFGCICSTSCRKDKRRNQRIELVAQHRAAHLDHGEARRVELREALEVLLDLLRAGHVGQQADDRGA